MLSSLYKGLHVKCPLFLSEINENPRIGHVVTYGRTDITKLIVAVSSFAKAPKKEVRNLNY
jgi:hypothetical protein